MRAVRSSLRARACRDFRGAREKGRTIAQTDSRFETVVEADAGRARPFLLCSPTMLAPQRRGLADGNEFGRSFLAGIVISWGTLTTPLLNFDTLPPCVRPKLALKCNIRAEAGSFLWLMTDMTHSERLGQVRGVHSASRRDGRGATQTQGLGFRRMRGVHAYGSLAVLLLPAQAH